MEIKFEILDFYVKGDEDRVKKLDDIAEETVLFLCDKLNELDGGISQKMLNYMCERINQKIKCIKFKN